MTAPGNGSGQKPKRPARPVGSKPPLPDENLNDLYGDKPKRPSGDPPSSKKY